MNDWKRGSLWVLASALGLAVVAGTAILAEPATFAAASSPVASTPAPAPASGGKSPLLRAPEVRVRADGTVEVRPCLGQGCVSGARRIAPRGGAPDGEGLRRALSSLRPRYSLLPALRVAAEATTPWRAVVAVLAAVRGTGKGAPLFPVQHLAFAPEGGAP